MRRIMVFLLSLLLSIPFSVGVNSDSIDAPSPLLIIPEGLTGHEPIEIDGNDDLNSTVITEGWGGSGTVEDPYVIKDLFIDGNGTSYCLRILNTTLPFKVLNCTFMNSSFGSSGQIYGAIQLINSTSIVLSRIESIENARGVYCLHSENITIEDSKSIDNNFGIGIEFTEGIFLANSYVNNSIHFSGSTYRY